MQMTSVGDGGRFSFALGSSSAPSQEARSDWALPRVEHPDVDMLERQSQAIRDGRDPLPYPGLPRDWVGQALDLVLKFDPDRVFLFGSVVRGEDTLRSDIDLLAAFEHMPVEVWDRWEQEIRYVARFFCPYPVNVFVTDVEDLVRMRHVVVSPCMWAQKEGRLVSDRQAVGRE